MFKLEYIGSHKPEDGEYITIPTGDFLRAPMPDMVAPDSTLIGVYINCKEAVAQTINICHFAKVMAPQKKMYTIYIPDNSIPPMMAEFLEHTTRGQRFCDRHGIVRPRLPTGMIATELAR